MFPSYENLSTLIHLMNDGGLQNVTKTKLNEIKNELNRLGYIYLARGTSRTVYKSKDDSHVIKLLNFKYKYSKYSSSPNVIETWYYAMYLNNKLTIPIAKCWLYSEEVMVMECVDPVDKDENGDTNIGAVSHFMKQNDLPWLVKFSRVDGCQVGYNSKKQLVAYDCGLEDRYLL